MGLVSLALGHNILGWGGNRIVATRVGNAVLLHPRPGASQNWGVGCAF